MKGYLDPKKFGLPPRTVLEQVGPGGLAIVMRRKSRIVMADGLKIVEKAAKIKKALPEVRIALQTSAPVCSRTMAYLEKEGIRVLQGK